MYRMTKEQIRTEMKNLRGQLNHEECLAMSEKIQEKLLNSEAYQNCLHLFTFLSFQSEIETRGIIRIALQERKRVYVPRVQHKSMEFYEIQNLNSLIKSKFGIEEPIPNKDTLFQGSDGEKLMILPGLAFDYYGNRIGYGAGYYDRYLRAHDREHMLKVAVAYDLQLFDELPSDEFDVKADYIITPNKIIKCRSNK